MKGRKPLYLIFTAVIPPKKSIIFLGTKPIGYKCLKSLIENQDALNFQVAGVLTQKRKEFEKQSDLGQLAGEHQIPVFDDPSEMPKCDILYSVQYHKILRKEEIERARIIAVNLHMAPLPEYRGCNQFSFAIIDGMTEFGTSLHQIDPRIDHGALLFEKRFPIPENCWVQDLYDLTEKASFELFKESLRPLLNGDYPLIDQKSLEASRGFSLHFRKEIQALKQIDLNWPTEKIERHIRATSMPGFEPPFTSIGGQRIYFSPKP